MKFKFDNSNLRKCWNCQDKFISWAKDERFCHKCKKSCYGCGGKFSPEHRNDVFCENCLDKLAEHQCTNCGVSTDLLNDRGHCMSCSRHHVDRPMKHFCSVCRVVPVSEVGELCFGCSMSDRVKKCPRCEDNSMDIIDYICNQWKSEE